MAAESAANASESRSTRNSIAMPPSCDVDQAPYDRSWVPLPVVPCTTNATNKAANDIVIDAAGERAVHRSGRGRLMSDAPPSSASRTAGDPTPTSTSQASGTLGIMRRVSPVIRASRRTLATMATGGRNPRLP